VVLGDAVNPFARHKRMFSERVDVLSVVPGEEDEMAGSTEGTPTPVFEDEPAYIEDLNAMDVAALSSQGLTVNTFVFLKRDPGPLPEGSRIDILRRAGVDYADPDTRPSLRVRRVMVSSLGRAALWRVECQTRS